MANKSLGQHWLKNREVLDHLASLAHADGVETCLEIGPGLGHLTSSLLKNFDQVIAVEFDQKLAENLPKSFPGKNLIVKNEDILSFDFKTVPSPFVVAGNIPYYITSPIIEKLLSLNPHPEKIVLLIQKEVADRLVAEKGKHTLLSLSAQNRAEIVRDITVPAEFFDPVPKVDSAVVILAPREKPQIPLETFVLIKEGMKNPRKKLTNNLKSHGDISKLLEKLNLPPTARPSELDLTDWQNLQNLLK
ncbi:ribosomal RNA small subunit methyltransferase A [Candidatus Saccharibacteria bacterium]|nr:ribosomal RNA small subunit methyltransferase A [Candidatus Saccharibacteria bacterium]